MTGTKASASTTKTLKHRFRMRPLIEPSSRSALLSLCVPTSRRGQTRFSRFIWVPSRGFFTRRRPRDRVPCRRLASPRRTGQHRRSYPLREGPMRARTAPFVVLLVAIASIATACGSSGKKSHEATTTKAGRSPDVVDNRTSSAAGAPKTQVVAPDNRFVPENIRVNPGQTVRWTNQGRNPHDILSASPETTEYAPKFGVQPEQFAPQGGTYEFKFTKPGVYLYYCSLHGTPDQGMVGAIIVGDAEWTPPKVREV